MGRENIMLQVDVKKKYVTEFIQAWNQFLTANNKYLNEENLLEEDFFCSDGIDPAMVSYEADEIANLFDWPNETGLLDFCKDLLKKYPDIEVVIDYDLSWDNCGDCCVESYHIHDHQIDYDIMAGECLCGEDLYEEMKDDFAEQQEEDPDFEPVLIDDVYYNVDSRNVGTWRVEQ